ncbi:MAG: tRNA (guanosine(46)-N7)-methyltransferase TrmB [Chitinophagales bacterium]|jgi:tRNA (guanine-N7-)-methyltransferase|nr:tRNA (guanosine(46)-N7)-methyltransferase TrmB [Chitinophagales bacterium]
MSKGKLEKFKELESMSNVFQNHRFDDAVVVQGLEEVEVKGRWHEIFGNHNPIVLELACGRGEYSVQMAKNNSAKNFIGIDIKGNRIHLGAKMALEENLNNVAFLRTRIEKIQSFFNSNEVDEIWITFPDPFPRFPDRKNRLISPKFLDIYRQAFCDRRRTYHLKTDNYGLFRYALGVLDGRGYTIQTCLEDIYHYDKKISDILKIQTYYEVLHQNQGAKINYVSWTM